MGQTASLRLRLKAGAPALYVASNVEKRDCVAAFQHALSTSKNESACDGIFKSAPQMIFAATADVVTLVKTMTAVCYWLFVAYTLADFCQYAIRPRSRESSARFSAHADSSVYIYIYIESVPLRLRNANAVYCLKR